MGRESDGWYDAYGTPEAIADRAGKFERKLARLGLIEALEPGPILDVACGFGEALNQLHAIGRRELVGIDLHDRPIEGAPERFSYVMGSGDALPFADGSFPNVLCFHSLHHMDSMEAIEGFLREAVRVLRPGGLLALIDHYDSIQMRLTLRLILSGLLSITPGLRALRAQLTEEWSAMQAFFNDWTRIRSAIEESGLDEEFFRKGLFFFYFRGRKPA